MGDGRITLGTIVTWIVIGVLAIVALKVMVRAFGILMGILGVVLGMVVFLLFTVGPIILIGWLAIKLWKAFTRETAA